MLSFLNQYGRNEWYSQNDEEGIIAECLKRLELTQGHAVEIGANNGFYCSNTAALVDSASPFQNQKWTGLMVEADYDLYLECKRGWSKYEGMRVQCSRVDGYNINAFVDERCDLLSLDTDGHDYNIFCGMLARPKIVIVEIDSSIEPPSERFNADGGAGYWSMTVAALERGFFILVHCGNLVLIRQEYAHLFPECKPHPLLEWELYFNRAWLP
jgi:hypothetical protein